MAGKIPSPHEPFVNAQGVITRTWYRVLNSFGQNSGVLSEPIVVKSNSFFQSGGLNSGSTLEPATIPSGTLLGNSSGSLSDATPQDMEDHPIIGEPY